MLNNQNLFYKIHILFYLQLLSILLEDLLGGQKLHLSSKLLNKLALNLRIYIKLEAPPSVESFRNF